MDGEDNKTDGPGNLVTLPPPKKRSGNPAWGNKAEGTGSTGNPLGAPPKKVKPRLSDSLRMALASNPERARQIGEKVLEMALGAAGEAPNLKAVELVLDRLEGKAIQTVLADVSASNADLTIEEKLARISELQQKALRGGKDE